MFLVSESGNLSILTICPDCMACFVGSPKEEDTLNRFEGGALKSEQVWGLWHGTGGRHPQLFAQGVDQTSKDFWKLYPFRVTCIPLYSFIAGCIVLYSFILCHCMVICHKLSLRHNYLSVFEFIVIVSICYKYVCFLCFFYCQFSAPNHRSGRRGPGCPFRQVLVFTSFVRCWVSDEQMLVAGLYNGALQAVHWKTGQKENIHWKCEKYWEHRLSIFVT